MICKIDEFVACVIVYVFFFKQKTAYEMRISDWSSDVCSSDLGVMRRAAARPQKIAPDPGVIGSFEISDRRDGNDCPVCKDGDAVADGIERVEIVRDDEHRQAQDRKSTRLNSSH